MNYVSPINAGVIVRSPQRPAAQRTLIVTGVARSGTTMLATMLRQAGVSMGEHLLDVVNEDAQMLAVLRSGNDWLLRALIERRNMDNDVWGFKTPDIHTFLTADKIGWFRDPRLVVVVRDPVAVAVRGQLSERYEETRGLVAICNGIAAVARFAETAGCPTLFVSYEKAIAFPERTVEEVADFCGLERDRADIDNLAATIRPNSPEYLASANRQFVGNIDGILDGQLSGWCHRPGSLLPVALELYAGDKLLRRFSADEFRDDLADIGIGNGNHGFYVDLTGHGLKPATPIRVKVVGRTFELDNSGAKLRDLPTMPSNSKWAAFAKVFDPAAARATAPILARGR